jgi:hypothetical protein
MFFTKKAHPGLSDFFIFLESVIETTSQVPQSRQRHTLPRSLENAYPNAHAPNPLPPMQNQAQSKEVSSQRQTNLPKMPAPLKKESISGALRQ